MMREGHLVTCEGVYVNKAEDRLGIGIKDGKLKDQYKQRCVRTRKRTSTTMPSFHNLHHVKQEPVTRIDEGHGDPIVSF